MKKYLLILSFALVVQGLSAQSLWKEDEPSLQPEIMTYFQDEMTSLMRFQIDRERKGNTSSFRFWGLAFQVVNIDEKEEEIDDKKVLIEGTTNGTLNLFGGYQIKLGNHLYLPLYAAGILAGIRGKADEGTVKTAGGYPLSGAETNESTFNLLAGAGLYLTAGFFKGGVFAAYHLNYYSATVQGIQPFNYPYGANKSAYHYGDTKHTFKLAFLPAVDTSEWRYVGKILNYALGYLGMGDMVGVFSNGKEDTDQGIAAIIAALNYALDFSFTPLEWGNARFGLRSFYRRDNYDTAARNDVYGGNLTASLLFRGVIPQLSFECGFRHFNEVSPYFTSKYPDTWFYTLNLSVIVNNEETGMGAFYKFFVRYDDITRWCFGFTLDFRSVILFGGAGIEDAASRMVFGGIRGRFVDEEKKYWGDEAKKY